MKYRSIKFKSFVVLVAAALLMGIVVSFIPTAFKASELFVKLSDIFVNNKAALENAQVQQTQILQSTDAVQDGNLYIKLINVVSPALYFLVSFFISFVTALAAFYAVKTFILLINRFFVFLKPGIKFDSIKLYLKNENAQASDFISIINTVVLTN